MAPQAAGTVDLSLPDYPTLVARAGGVDPRLEAQRVANAEPGTVGNAGAAFNRAGGEMDASFTQSMAAADTLGAGFTNNGTAVLDRSTHLANLPVGFGDAGTRLAGAGRRMGAVADDLSGTMTDTAAAVNGMNGDLATMQRNWNQRVAAAGLIPQEAVPGLLAERDRVAADMVTRVTDAGQQVTKRIASYQVVVNDALRLLADQGFVPPADLTAAPPPPPTPPTSAGGVDPAGLGTPVTAGYAADPVNTACGNFVEVETDLPFTGLLAGLTVARTYNSRNGDDAGPFGPGWSSWASTRLVETAWTADYAGPDGQRIRFPRTGTGFVRMAGISALVERRGGDATEGGLTLAWFDGRRWDFAADGRLARTWAGPGTEVRHVHDGGRLVALVHERGRRVDLAWDGDRIVALTASDGRRVDHRYDGGGRLVEAAGPAGPRRYALDEAGLIASVTDADGVVELVNTYDDRGRVRTQRSPFGRLVTFSYEPDGATVVADDSAGPTNVYRHDPAGRLVALTDGHGQTLHKRYDVWGNPVEIVERGGDVTRQEFDDRTHLVRRTLPSGAVHTFTWDTADRLVAVTATGAQAGTATSRLHYEGAERSPSEIVDPDGGVTRLQVAGGLVHALTDPDGVTVRLRHDPDGNLTEVVDAGGGVVRVERDPAGLVRAVVTAAGRRTELVPDAHGRLVTRRDPAGGLWRYEYTAAGRLAATVDPTGARTETRYGPHGRATETVDALGAVSTHRYDDFGNLADLTTVAGKWAFRHDALSRLTAVTDPAGGTWLHEHDVDGRRTADVDPTGVRTDYRRGPKGRITGVDDGVVVTAYEHDELGRPVREVRADGTTRTLTYDRCGRVRTETGPDGGTTRYDYSPAGRLRRVEAPSGRTEEYVHDDRGRLVARVDGNGHRWTLRHDADGLVVEQTSPTGLVETLDRDPCGRVVRHRRPGHGTVVSAYDPAGRVVALADRAGRRTFARDAAGRVVTATDALGHTTRYAWDPRGTLAAVTDPLGGRTHYEHDEVGRVTAVVDPLGRATRYAYDAAGRLVARIEPTGVERRVTYDVSGRVRTTVAGTALAVAVERDALGRTVRVTETGAPPITLRRDAAGRLVERRRGDRAVGWSYDADGLRTRLTHPDGTATDYRRDAAGRVTGLHHPLLGWVELHRDPDGRLRTRTGAGTRARWTYRDGWLAEHEAAGPRGASSTRLVRDADGRVVSAETDGRARMLRYDAGGQLVEAVDATGESTYAYDPCGRLVAETGPRGQHRHTYDAAGQLTSSTGPDGRRRHRYDAVGRRIADDGENEHRRYRWDGLGRLTGVDTVVDGHARTTAVRVDALGELAEVAGVPLSWDSADPTAPPVALGDRSVIGHGHPWALADAATGDTWSLDPDWQHTVNPAGGPARGADDPWGSPASGPPPASETPDPAHVLGLGYRGEVAVDGLVWLRARAYDPGTRAFLSPDPLPPVPGTPFAANAYHYAGNDPVNGVDPLGLRPTTDADVAGHRDSGYSLFSTIGHGVLDVVGLIPGVGAVADVVNAGWYLAEGDYTMAALSALTAIPVLGAGAVLAKVGVKGARVVEGVEAAEEATSFARTASRVPDYIADSRVAEDVPDLYRGVPHGHPGYEDATQGIARPRGGHADPALHNGGNTQSVFTSWTRDEQLAHDIAGEGNGPGVVMRIPNADGPGYSRIASPDVYGESEVLIKGPVHGAEVIR